jgi:hypothetical protein
MFYILLDQITRNGSMGIYPEGLRPAAVQVDHSPTMPVDHEQWSTPPHLPIELTETRTCFLVTVTHDTPAAMALYAMASNQAPTHPILHPPTGSRRIDTILAHQHLLVTRAPGSPPATTGPRPAVACTAFTSRTPAESWQLLKRALALELRNILAKKANED